MKAFQEVRGKVMRYENHTGISATSRTEVVALSLKYAE
jgi:hypothetical protein